MAYIRRIAEKRLCDIACTAFVVLLDPTSLPGAGYPGLVSICIAYPGSLWIWRLHITSQCLPNLSVEKHSEESVLLLEPAY
jgi:hypothetical protein